MTGTDTLAYYEHSLLTDVKRFITLGPGANVIKLFTSVFFNLRTKLELCENRLGKLVRDKRSSLLQNFVNYGRKKFYNIGPRPFATFVKNYKPQKRPKFMKT